MLNIVPGYPVKDIEASLRFYEQTLGFQTQFKWGQPTRYAQLQQGGVHIAICLARPPYIGPVSGYIHMTGVEAFFQKIQAAGAPLEYGLTLQEYGMKDFAVIDPDGNRLTFGEDVEE